VFKILTFFLLFISVAKRENVLPEPVVIEGKTMGTTYRVIYFDEPYRRNFKSSVDSLLLLLNSAISTYDPGSEISHFNRSTKGTKPESFFFYDILKKSKRVNRRSHGAFDPTVMPLVNAWGFGPEKLSSSTPTNIDSLKNLVGFNKVRVTKNRITKKRPGIQLDLGGIGQGYGADVIVQFLKERGVDDMLVELGGEGVALGSNLEKDKPWTIGILDPNSTPDNQFFKAYVRLQNRAFTTSGNYFNYRIIGGRKYGHTIDPETGHPVQHSLLSASVFAPACTDADAWATAFMVMGIERAIEKVKRLRDLDAIFIYSDDKGELKTYITAGISKQVTLE
jgi:thiamine biosynthesis lipoprotein